MKEAKELIEKRNEILEDIQEAIVNAGGRFFRREELKHMDVCKLLSILVPNSVEIKIEYKHSA